MQEIFVFTGLCRMKEVLSCTVCNEVNHHATAEVKGIAEDIEERHILKSDLTIIHVRGAFLFQGVVTKADSCLKDRKKCVSIHGVSHTIRLDRCWKNRGFLDRRAVCGEVVSRILLPYYPGRAVLGREENAQLRAVLVQYEETDWQFLKRLAGTFGTVVIPDESQPVPHLSFGTVTEGTVTAGSLRFRKIRNESELIAEGAMPLRLCSRLWLFGDFVYLYKRIAILRQGKLVYRYWFRPWEQIIAKKGGNERIRGQLFEGNVKAVWKQWVMVEADGLNCEGKRAAGWFSFERPGENSKGSSEWYLLPEKGDTVTLYFPDDKEEHAYLIGKENQDTRLTCISK